jgi:Flp pilus assembly protein TadG
MHRPGKYQRGAEIVEFLITLPVVLILLAIVFDFGIAFSEQTILNHATRAAAREVIRGGSDDEAQQAADQVTQSLLSRDPADPLPAVTVNRFGTDPGDTATITIGYNYPYFLLPAFIGLSDINLSATTVMNIISN